MKDSKKSSKDDEPTKPAPERLPAATRLQVAARLEESVYRKVARAAADNRCSVSAEVERRIVQSFETQARPDDALQRFWHKVMAAFEEAGQQQSRTIAVLRGDESQVVPASEWLRDGASYTAAMACALDVLSDRHPHPNYFNCRHLVSVLSARMNRGWQMLLGSADPDERKRLIEEAEMMERLMPPALSSLLLPRLPGKKDEG